MNPCHYLSPKIPDPGLPTLTGRRIAAAFPYAMGAALQRAVKGMLALVPQVVRSGTARPLAAEDRNSVQCAGQWIEPRQPLVMPMTSRLVIACDAGSVWITQGDSNDYVLQAGEELVVQPVGTVIITAMKDAAFVRYGRQPLRVPDKSALCAPSRIEA